jgi:CTP synthase
MHIAVIEFARHGPGISTATSEEFDAHSPSKGILLMHDQRNIKDKGGTMRLGRSDYELMCDTIAMVSYESKKIVERHRHRYEFNPTVEKLLSKMF